MIWAIEDEAHADTIGRYGSRAAAWAELERLAAIAWNAEPNAAPCRGWRTGGRRYELACYDDAQVPWREQSREEELQVSAAGASWKSGAGSAM